MNAVADQKRLLRDEAKSRRAALTEHSRAAAISLSESFCSSLDVLAPGNVAAYWPIHDEIDVRPLMVQLTRLGRTVSLPVVVGRDEALIFRAWSEDVMLEEGSFGTMQPVGGLTEITPNILLMPLLAFDAGGGRLGYGGGYYDRTLTALRKDGHIMAVGIAYAGQEIAHVPMAAEDQYLDWIATETGVRKLGAEKN
jgi:5-formyltetrahydrofolate cyclo-ligase